jgi:hypothetical protein
MKWWEVEDLYDLQVRFVVIWNEVVGCRISK